MSIEIMHVDFQTHGTNILEVLQKIAGSLFFYHPVVRLRVANSTTKGTDASTSYITEHAPGCKTAAATEHWAIDPFEANHLLKDRDLIHIYITINRRFCI